MSYNNDGEVFNMPLILDYFLQNMGKCDECLDTSDGNIEYNNVVKYLIVPPHPGNCWRYLVRISTQAAFDRWSNSIPIEEFFNSEIEVVEWLRKNESFILYTLIEYLSEEYSEMEQALREEIAAYRGGKSFDCVRCQLKQNKTALS